MGATAPAQTIYITAKDNPSEMVSQYRANERALHRLRRQYVSTRSAATNKAIRRREHDRYLVEVSVLAFGSHKAKVLLGALVEERDMAALVAEAEQHGHTAPSEAQRRLVHVRRVIAEQR